MASFDLEIRGPAWQAEALSATLAADLASDQLRLVPDRGELHVAITIGDRELSYVLSRDGVAPVRGVIPAGSADRVGVAGVLKDQLHALVPHEAVVEEADLPPPAASVGAFVALAILAAVLVAPLRRKTRAAVRLIAALAGVAVAAVAIVVGIQSTGSLFVVGGLAWGAAATTMFPIAFPILPALHRVEHRELGIALRTWIAMAVQRIVALALLLAPIAAIVWLAGLLLDVPPVVTAGVIAPFVLLCIRLGWHAVVELVAAKLDAQLVGDQADAWHAQVRGYFVGYLRRANLDVDEDLLSRVRFLPGKDPERVAVYGGGITHTRIVIGRAMLERALAPYGRPHDYAMPRVSTLHWTHWNSGLVMPTATDEKLASRADRDPKTSAHASEAGEHERIALGEPPTLSGIIEPVAFDPRRSYRPDEDPLWLDWDPGEEHDGTDAGDKDFLFGLLVHALGVAQRREDGAATLALASPIAAKLVRALSPRSRLDDLHAVLGGARHHVAQYLAWQIWQREDLLTARAYVPELEAKSRMILATLDAEPEARGDERPTAPAERARLAALRWFIDPRAPIKRTQRQRLVLAFALVTAFAVVAGLVIQAALYHSTYEERRSDGKRN